MGKTPAAASPRLIIISAPSAAGKTTLMKKLISTFPDRYVASVSTTTRAPRKGETPGRDYIFVTEAEFKSRIAQGGFAEWALVHGSYYGTSLATIESTLASGKSVVLTIDVQGAASLRKLYPERTFSVFINPPSLEVLEKRLRERTTDSDASIAVRIENAKQEMAHAHEFDAIVVNDDLERAFGELTRLLHA